MMVKLVGINLKTDPISKSFKQYLWPALTGMAIKSLFIIADGWFIGQGVGAEGLGALSLVIPPFSIFTAIAMMIGIGGAARMSIDLGRGDSKSGQTWLNQSLSLVTIISLVSVILTMIWLDSIITLMGADGEMARLAHEFLWVLTPFFTFYSIGWVLSCFVRNDANPKLATYAMSIGAISNIVLDYIFIMELDMGMRGAGIATAISQVIIFGVLLIHFVGKQGTLRLNLLGLGFNKALPIMNLGLPTFFIELTSALTILLFNYVLLSRFEETYLIAYGLTTNIGVFALFVMVGIAQACQPIMSFNFGAGSTKKVEQTLMLGLKVAD